jgi:hypothetical protein
MSFTMSLIIKQIVKDRHKTILGTITYWLDFTRICIAKHIHCLKPKLNCKEYYQANTIAIDLENRYIPRNLFLVSQ